MRGVNVLVCAGLVFLVVPVTVSHAAHVSSLEFEASMYLGNVPDVEGRYAYVRGDYSLNWDIPSGLRPWYLGVALSGQLVAADGTDIYLASLEVNDLGIGLTYGAESEFVDWNSLGVSYVPGLGIYIGDYDLSPLASLDPASLIGSYAESDWYLTIGTPGNDGYDYYIEGGLYASLEPFDPDQVQWIAGDLQGRITLTTPTIPEPASSILVLLGLAATSCMKKTKKPGRQVQLDAR